MTTRERIADAMRLKDAELRGVVGAPAWGQLTTTDQARWLTLTDAGEQARTDPTAPGIPFASLRIVHERPGDLAYPTACAVVADGHVVAKLPASGYTLDMGIGDTPSILSVRMLVRDVGDVVTHVPKGRQFATGGIVPGTAEARP